MYAPLYEFGGIIVDLVKGVEERPRPAAAKEEQNFRNGSRLENNKIRQKIYTLPNKYSKWNFALNF